MISEASAVSEKYKWYKSSKIILLLMFAFFNLNSLMAEGTTKIIKPKNSDNKTVLIISGINRIYYPLTINEPAVINVKGPGKLKIITRICFKPDDNADLDYSIYYRLDGVEKIKVDFNNVERSNDAEFYDDNLGIPGFGKSISIKLSRGEHTIEFWQEDGKYFINSRYLFTKTKEKKIDWVALSPLQPNEPVNLVTNENVVTYYRFSNSKLLKVRITGPTILRILSRVENHYYMKGAINYRLQVKEDGILKNTYMLNSNRSDVAMYKKGKSKVPGKAKEILIDVPSGKHVYSIILLDKDKSTILGRILFPKKDVRIKE